MTDEENHRVKGNKVTRKEADEVFYATATEPLRKGKAKTPLHLHQAQRDRNNREGEEIVEKSKRGKRK